jgi:trimeric autotransporter adhesin
VNADEVKKVNGGSWTASSDRRLKQDIHDYQAGLEDIVRIRPVHFRYNELSGYNTDREYIGIIAQELQAVAPYMVSTFVKDGQEYLQVDNSAMTYMLVNAVRELKEKNNALEDQNGQLEKRLDQLTGMVEELMKVGTVSSGR